MTRCLSRSGGPITEAWHHVIRQVSRREVMLRREELNALLHAALSNSKNGSALEVDREVALTLDMAAHAATYRTFVAEGRHGIAGTVIGSVDEGGASSFVRWVVVRPDVRRQGVGHGLVNAFEAAAETKRVTGWVNLDDPVAAAFWRGRGWQPLAPPPRRIMMGRRV